MGDVINIPAFGQGPAVPSRTGYFQPPEIAAMCSEAFRLLSTTSSVDEWWRMTPSGIATPFETFVNELADVYHHIGEYQHVLPDRIIEFVKTHPATASRMHFSVKFSCQKLGLDPEAFMWDARNAVELMSQRALERDRPLDGPIRMVSRLFTRSPNEKTRRR